VCWNPTLNQAGRGAEVLSRRRTRRWSIRTGSMTCPGARITRGRPAFVGVFMDSPSRLNTANVTGRTARHLGGGRRRGGQGNYLDRAARILGSGPIGNPSSRRGWREGDQPCLVSKGLLANRAGEEGHRQ